MKSILRYLLQRILGFSNYLHFFSIVSIKRVLAKKTEPEFRHFITLLDNEGVILDIGANIGITTIPLSIAKPEARIFSFEPIPANIRALKRAIGFFKVKNVKVFETALGNETGETVMITPVVNSVKMQGLSHIKDSGLPYNENEIRVPVNRLDDIPELFTATKISGIKIDVENYEYHVLSGGRELLTKYKPIIYCELWKNEVRDSTINMLLEMNYQVFVFENGKLQPPSDTDTINFFFIPK